MPIVSVANCSTGAAELLAIMEEYRQHTGLPLLVEPNAGMPELINGQTIFKETPADMARFAEPFRALGVNLLGACCGSTPAHIKAMGEALTSRQPAAPAGTIRSACDAVGQPQPGGDYRFQ
ncbi:MAG: homocysteine S-methyltransferase family protein [Candidatus Syntrophopropionicum ammoniitolerans]